jgi:transcriptional/translational regulatory protein YebC/TACO1
VAFLFEQKGVLVIENEQGAISEERILEDALLDGVQDLQYEDGAIELTTNPSDFRAVREALEALGYSFASAGVEYVPTTLTKMADPALDAKMQRLIDMLEDNDDVQEVYHNWDMPQDE